MSYFLGEENKTMNNKQNNKKHLKICILIVVACLLISFSIIAPIIFTKFSIYDLTNPDNSIIADTIYGLTGPFIAIGAAFLTFAAFLVQKEANDIQIKNYQTQYDKDKIESFENRLFKLIELHRKNVLELDIDGKKGQDAISNFNYNIKLITKLISEYDESITKNLNKYDIQILSYLICTYADSLLNDKWFLETSAFRAYAKEDEIIKKLSDQIEILKNTGSAYSCRTKEETNFLEKDRKNYILIQLKIDNMNILSRYFRQIFQIYKFIDNQYFLNKEQKYEYAKIFRTSISNAEQELMYNNILSPFGDVWRKNDFIKKYHPFKNIASYTEFIYSPKDYLADVEKIKEEDLSKYLDILTFKN